MRGAEIVEPVGIRPNRSTNSPNRTVLTEFFATFAPFKRHVSRQSSNPGRREGPSEGSGRVQAGDRREIRAAILHHKSRWEGCSSVSLRGVGADRAEVGGALQFQSHEEEVSGSDELLRAAGGNGWAGPVAAAAVVAGIRTNQGRGSGSGQSDVPRGQKPGAVQE